MRAIALLVVILAAACVNHSANAQAHTTQLHYEPADQIATIVPADQQEPITYDIINIVNDDEDVRVDYNRANPYVVRNMANGVCSTRASCYKGYCWAYCGASMSSGTWCYTTKTFSQSKAYVKCTKNSECNPCWNCAVGCGK